MLNSNQYAKLQKSGLSSSQQAQVISAAGGYEKPKTALGFAGNVVKSGAKTALGIGSSLVNVFNPDMQKNTVANVARLGVGTAQLLDPTQVLGTGQEQTARNVGKFYNDRYGISDIAQGKFGSAGKKIGNTLYEDPVGAALDASTVLGGVGGLTKGLGSLAESSTLGRVGNVFSKASEFTDPLQLVGKGVGRVTKGLPEGVSNVFSRGSNQADVIENTNRLKGIAKAEGVDLPLSATTNNQFIRQGETMTAKGLFGKGVSDKFDQATAMPNEMLRRVTEPNVGDVSAVKNSLGQSVRGELKTFSKGFKDKVGTIYDDVEKTLGNAPVKPTKTQEMISQLFDQQRQSAIPQGSSQKLLEDIYYNLENSDTYSKLNQTRKDLGQLMNSTDPLATGQQAQLKAIYNAIQKDLDTVVETSPQARTAYATKQATDSKWNEFRTLLNKQEGKQILGDITDIEDIVPRIYKPNNVSSIKRLKQFVTPQTFKELGDTLLTEIVNSSVGKDGLIDPRRWSAAIKRWDKPTLVEAIGADGVRKLEEISKVVDDAQFARTQIGSATKSYNGSQTAMLANTGIGASSLTGSVLTLNPIPILSYLGANALGAGLFGTTTGRNLLSGTAKLPDISRITSNPAIGVAKNVFSTTGRVGRMINDPIKVGSTNASPQSPIKLKEQQQVLPSYPPSILPASPSPSPVKAKYKKIAQRNTIQYFKPKTRLGTK